MRDPQNWNEFKQFINECKFVTYGIESSKNLPEGLSDEEYEKFEPDLIYVHRSGELFYNMDTGHFLHPYLDHRGCGDRHRVDMFIGGKWEQTIVARVVADAFMLNAKNKEHVHHIDGDRKNNEYHNLIYVTAQEHRELHALLRKGEDSEYWKRINRLRKDSPFYIEAQPIFPQ